MEVTIPADDASGEVHLCTDGQQHTIEYSGTPRILADLLYLLYKKMPHGTIIAHMVLERLGQDNSNPNDTQRESNN